MKIGTRFGFDFKSLFRTRKQLKIKKSVLYRKTLQANNSKFQLILPVNIDKEPYRVVMIRLVTLVKKGHWNYLGTYFIGLVCWLMFYPT